MFAQQLRRARTHTLLDVAVAEKRMHDALQVMLLCRLFNVE